MLEPFTSIEATLDPRPRGGLRTLESAAVLVTRAALSTSLEKIALGSWILELAAGTAPEGEAASRELALAEDALDALGGRADLVLRVAFELRLLDALGFRPESRACVACGARLSETRAFDLAEGGALCEAHAAGARRIGDKTAAWLEAVLEAPGFDPAAGLPEDWAARAAEKLAPFTRGFLERHLGRRPKSAELLADLALLR